MTYPRSELAAAIEVHVIGLYRFSDLKFPNIGSIRLRIACRMACCFQIDLCFVFDHFGSN